MVFRWISVISMPLPACLHVDFVSRVHVGAKGLLAASVLYLLWCTVQNQEQRFCPDGRTRFLEVSLSAAIHSPFVFLILAILDHRVFTFRKKTKWFFWGNSVSSKQKREDWSNNKLPSYIDGPFRVWGNPVLAMTMVEGLTYDLVLFLLATLCQGMRDL